MSTIKAGTYRFNDTPTQKDIPYQNIRFSCVVNGEVIEWITIGLEPSGYIVYSPIGGSSVDDVAVYNFFRTWVDEAYKTITIHNDTEVTAEFYEWFTANTVEQKTIKAGKYRFNDVLTTPPNYGDNYLDYTIACTVNLTQELLDEVNALLEQEGYPLLEAELGVYKIRYNQNALRFANGLIYWFIQYSTESIEVEPANEYLAQIVGFSQANEVYQSDAGWDNHLVELIRVDPQTITIPEDTEVSAKFAQWFDENAKPYTTISGTWIINDKPTWSNEHTEKVNFISNGKSYSSLNLHNGGSYEEIRYYYSDADYDYDLAYHNEYVSEWYDEAYRTITFVGEQSVSQQAVDWLMTNAVEQKRLSGKWKFKYILSVPPIIDEYVNFEFAISALGFNATGKGERISIAENDSFRNLGMSYYYKLDPSSEGEQTLQQKGVYDWDSNTWSTGTATSDAEYQIIDFGVAPQIVSANFYEWFVTNAYSLTDDIDYLIKKSTLMFIADSIKTQTGKIEEITPIEMPKEILSIKYEVVDVYNGEVEVE